jgi:hypothetical protein
LGSLAVAHSLPDCDANNGSFFLRVIVVSNRNTANSAALIQESLVAVEEEGAEVFGIIMETWEDGIKVRVAFEGVGRDSSCVWEITELHRPGMHCANV